jgi:hypothetical protein
MINTFLAGIYICHAVYVEHVEDLKNIGKMLEIDSELFA